MKRTIVLLGLILGMILPFVSAAHYLVGHVTGENVNGNLVFVYSPTVGLGENVTDIIGPMGNSGTDNYYMVDCENRIVCGIGDEVRATIDGINYVSLIVTGAGYDMFPDLIFSAPIPECSNGERKCQENDSYACQDNIWKFNVTCEYGCELGECKAPPILKECYPGEKKCQNNESYVCLDNKWALNTTCLYGCESGECKPKPTENCLTKPDYFFCKLQYRKSYLVKRDYYYCQRSHGIKTICDLGFCGYRDTSYFCAKGCNSQTAQCIK